MGKHLVYIRQISCNDSARHGQIMITIHRSNSHHSSGITQWIAHMVLCSARKMPPLGRKISQILDLFAGEQCENNDNKNTKTHGFDIFGQVSIFFKAQINPWYTKVHIEMCGFRQLIRQQVRKTQWSSSNVLTKEGGSRPFHLLVLRKTWCNWKSETSGWCKLLVIDTD